VILVVDVGNTETVLGIYDQSRLLHHWHLGTNYAATADDFGIAIHHLFLISGIRFDQIEGVVISSVVPPLMFVLEQFCSKYLNRTPLTVGPGVKTGLNIRYDNPRDVGADRIANAVAAIELYGPPLIIVDFGTATTFCYIDASGQYIGGAIAPGVAISTEALYQHAAKLPRIELAKPKSTVGRNIVTSMQAGIVFGFAGQVDGIVKRIKKEFKTEPTVVATGGMAELIAKESETIQVINPFLTLQGLQIIYERNKSS